MDAALIEQKAVNKIKGLVTAAKKVKRVVGDVDPFAYATPEDIYALALKAKGFDVKKYPRSAWRGMAEVVVSDSAVKTPVMPAAGYDKEIFPHLAKKGA